MSAQTRHRCRRPAAWDRHRGHGLPIALKAAQGELNLPPGLWQISDYAATGVAHGKGTRLVAATHSNGEPFLLLVAPDGRVLGLSAESDAGLQLIDLSDPTGWARRQTWELQPLGATP